jgi:hypothetical protein
VEARERRLEAAPRHLELRRSAAVRPPPPRRRRAKQFAGLALLPMALGCATFAEYPEVRPVAPATPRSLDVIVSVGAYLVTDEYEAETSRTRGYTAEVLRALGESGLFAPVVEGGSAGELEGTVVVTTHQSEIHGSSLLALLTFFLIPTAIDYEVAVDLTLRERRTGRTALSEKSFGFRTWYQLFLAPVSFFPYSPESFESHLTRSLTRDAAAECLAAVSAPLGS